MTATFPGFGTAAQVPSFPPSQVTRETLSQAGLELKVRLYIEAYTTVCDQIAEWIIVDPKTLSDTLQYVTATMVLANPQSRDALNIMMAYALEPIKRVKADMNELVTAGWFASKGIYAPTQRFDEELKQLM